MSPTYEYFIIRHTMHCCGHGPLRVTAMVHDAGQHSSTAFLQHNTADVHTVSVFPAHPYSSTSVLLVRRSPGNRDSCRMSRLTATLIQTCRTTTNAVYA